MSDKKEKLIYVASPLGDIDTAKVYHNMYKAREYMSILSMLDGIKAIAPHAFLPHILDDHDKKQRSLGLEFGQKFLALCDMLVLIVSGVKTTWSLTTGMLAEMETAEKLGIPIMYLSVTEITQIKSDFSIKGVPSDPTVKNLVDMLRGAVGLAV